MTAFAPPDPPPGRCVRIARETPLVLDCGRALTEVPVAYCSYGRLNADRSNVILVAHALSGDQVVAGLHPVTGRPGWWDRMVGPGKILDTDRFFILCANVLGGCMGSLGPASRDPETDAPYGPDFPPVTIADMVRCQTRLLDELGIDQVFCVIGGSMGGMQALQWLKDYPQRVRAAAPLAIAARHSPQQIALHAIGREAIRADGNWQEGRYYDAGHGPVRGLKVARMLAHFSYRSPEELDARFGRRAADPASSADFEVERYLAYQGERFVERFDANSYMIITKAMDAFEIAPSEGLAAAFAGSSAPVFLAGYSTDRLYPPDEVRELAEALAEAGHPVSFHIFEALKGHDSFLLEQPEQDAALIRFLNARAEEQGLAASA